WRFLPSLFFAVLGFFPEILLALGVGALRSLAYLPILQFYRISPLWAVALPVIAAAYAAFTLDSAYQHWRGRGGLWKGRSQALAAKRGPPPLVSQRATPTTPRTSPVPP